MITIFFVTFDDDNKNGSANERSNNNSSSIISSNNEWSDNTIVTYLFCLVVGIGLFSALLGYLFGRYSSLDELKQEVIAEKNAADQRQDKDTAAAAHNNMKTTLISAPVDGSSRRSPSGGDYTVLPVDLSRPSTSLYAFNRRGGWSRKPLRKNETFAGSSHTSTQSGDLTTPPRARQGDTSTSLEREGAELNYQRASQLLLSTNGHDQSYLETNIDDDVFMSASNSILTTTASRVTDTLDVSRSSAGSFDLTVSILNSPLTPPSSSYKYRPTTPAEDRYGKTKAYLRPTMDNLGGSPMSASLCTPEKVRTSLCPT